MSVVPGDVAAGGLGAADAGAVLRRHGRTFAFASHLLGTRHARRAAVLYAFCRHVDDVADEARDAASARAALATIRDALLTGRANDRWTQAMLALQRETRMPSAPALDLLAGVEGDLDAVRLPDEDALVRYAYRVAGTVGLMMCAGHARMGRRYLPASWIGEVAPAAIAQPDASLEPRLRDATRRLLALAERYYASGEAGLAFLPPRARLAILAAARMYRAIGGRIAAAGHRSWDRRAVVGPAAKTGHSLQALLAFALSPRLHRRDAVHEASLQFALQPRVLRHD